MSAAVVHLLDARPGVLCGSPKWKDATTTEELATCKRCLDVAARELARRARQAVTETRAEIPRQPGRGR